MTQPKRKRRAYPKVGSGEDFPARRPGTRIGETRSGGKVLTPTNATKNRQRAKTRAAENRRYVTERQAQYDRGKAERTVAWRLGTAKPPRKPSASGRIKPTGRKALKTTVPKPGSIRRGARGRR